MFRQDDKETGRRHDPKPGRKSGNVSGLPTWNPIPVWLRGQVFWSGLTDAVRQESERGRLVLWSPCAVLLGIAFYFLLPREPWMGALMVAGVVLATLAVLFARSGRNPIALTGFALVFIGMAAAKFETDRSLSPRLPESMTAKVTGIVNRIEPAKRNRLRLTIAPETIEGLGVDEIPHIIRVSAINRGQELTSGDRVGFLARMQPPSGPVMPGGYDFSFPAYFEGRGAGGYVIGKVEILQNSADRTTFWRTAADSVNRIRSAVGRRIGASLPEASGTIARALIVGERRAIPARIVDDLREAGLAHILAISGLHMVLLTGTVFWVARALLALSPGLALNYPIKKWAGGIAFAVGFLYLLISGASVATERAFIMVGVALLAILIDRPALTLRSLAVAAFLVGIAFPHSVMGPSFQMSFLAVAALIGLAEWAAARPARQTGGNSGRAGKIVSKLKFYFLGLASTSLLAGAATAPLAAYHFHTFAPYSLLGNLAAMPIVGLLIMPVGFLGCLLIPFGLDDPAFLVMGAGIDLVVAIAGFVADLSDGAEHVGMISVLTPILCAGGILWTAIWQTPWRWAGTGLFALGIGMAPMVTPPHIVINAAGTAVLVNSDQASVSVMRGRGSSFETRIWMRAYADHRGTRDKTLSDGIECDAEGCVFQIQEVRPTPATGPEGIPGKSVLTGTKIVLARTRQALVEDCQNADILVSRYDAPAYCPKPRHIFDRRRLSRTGSVSITLGEGRPDNVAQSKSRRARPWQAPNVFLNAATDTD